MAYLCPVCKSQLQWGGRAVYQTTDEHVTHPNHEPPSRSFYYCDNAKCDANSPEETNTRRVLLEKSIKVDPNSIVVFWDSDGELYGSPYNIKFIDNNYCPFGSEARRMSVEIYKKDENKILVEFLGFRVNVEYRYKSDVDGNILSRKGEFTFWKKDGIGYTNIRMPFGMFWFYNKKFRNNIDNFRKNKSVFAGRNLNELFRRKYNKSSSSRLFAAYLHICYPRLAHKLKDPKYSNEYS